MKDFVVTIIFLVLCTGALGQSEYPIFKDSNAIDPQKEHQLSLEIDNLNYLKNYEYFGNIPLSYTLFGYQLIPQIKYQLNENFLLKSGIFLRHEFGLRGFAEIEPVFTVKYQKRDFSFLMGNLEGAANHRFVEPIYNIEKIINNRMEQGAQIVLDKDRFWLDWFIDWEKAIKRNSPFREELTTGISGRMIVPAGEKNKFEFPIQFLLAHKGGQIDTSELPVESLLNLAAGISFQRQMETFLKGIRTEHYFVYYKDLSSLKLQLFDEGRGYYSSVTFQTKLFDLDLRYWRGNQFIGPKGGPLYNSVSEKLPGYTEKDRELFFLSIIYNKQLHKNIFLDLRFEPYYDFRNKMIEYSYGLMLKFRKEFTLLTTK